MVVNFQQREFGFKGKLITGVDESLIGDNFSILKNLRYTDNAVAGIGGMEKINTTVLSDYPRIKSIFFFRKDFPSEARILVRAFNSDDTASVILQNSTAIPSQGDFSATELWVDDTAAGQGRFSPAPGGAVVYCNGTESVIWGGDETRCAGFINTDASWVLGRNYTTEVSNTLDDGENVAVLTQTAGEGLDAATMLLLHFDGNFTDSSLATPHTVTAVGDAATSAAQSKYGTESCLLDGTGDYLTIPDSPDFDFRGKMWCVDFWLRPTTLTNGTLYHQEIPSSGSMEISLTSTGRIKLVIESSAGSIFTFTLQTATGVVSTGSFQHIAVKQRNNTYYIFVGGVLKASAYSTRKTKNYTSVVSIGSGINGYIDEYRVSNRPRQTKNFTPRATAYGSANSAAYFYLGSTRPIKGFYPRVKTANVTASTVSVSYWDGTAWVAVESLVDGTDVGGVSFAQSGVISFDSTEAVAQSSFIGGVFLYWYRVTVSSISVGTTVSYVTVDAPFQSIKDLWDGQFRTCLSFKHYDDSASKYYDYTTGILEEDYVSGSGGSFAPVGAMTSADYLYAGFTERMQALYLKIPDDHNTNVAALSVAYWNGIAWAAVAGLTDDTSLGSKTLKTSGLVSWSSISLEDESTRQLEDSDQLYFYRLAVNATLSATVRLDYIAGVTVPEKLPGHKFAAYIGNRLWLCAPNGGAKNSARCSATYTTEVWNGEDTAYFEFGEDTELTAATFLYTQFGSSFYNIGAFCKERETWALIGNGPDDWVVFPVSKTAGCLAPETMLTAYVEVQVSPETGVIGRQVGIWQGAEGIYLFDGKSLITASNDIKNIFDRRSSDHLNFDVADKSTAFFDNQRQEYHWLCATGESTAQNREFVLDVRRMRWFEVDRGAKQLQCGTPVSNGGVYYYGATLGGYLMRLEHTNSFDGTAIAHSVQWGELAMQNNSVNVETNVRGIKLVTKAKNTTTSNITLTHYIDGKTSGTTHTLEPAHSGYRLASPEEDLNAVGIFHKFKFDISTSDETSGFEPLYMAVNYKTVRQDT